MTRQPIPNDIRAYFRFIGARGGRSGKGSPARIAANRRTALNRTLKEEPTPKKVKIKLDT